MPSNAVVNSNLVHPFIHRMHGSEEVSKFTDATVDYGIIQQQQQGKKLPTQVFLAQPIQDYQRPIVLIDNTRLAYFEIRLPCGVRTMCAPEILSSCPMILRSLQTDVQQILKILPRSVHALVLRTTIWVNASYKYGSRDDPRVLRHSTAHHSEGWLIHCAKDIPDKARGIEIYNCHDFERMRLHWNGCGLLLHEFCHLIHQFCLDLNNETIKDLYAHAKYSGRYDQTLRRDWAGKDEDYDMAYALVDHKEFFAEMSVTFLSNGYHELNKADNSIMECCSPPLLQPCVSDRVLQKHGIEDPLERPEDCTCSFAFLPKAKRYPKSKLRIVNPILQETAISRSCLGITHCNKFFPFTKGQLKHHDPDLFTAMQSLWREIARWDDPESDSKSFFTLFPPPLFC